MEFGTQLRAWRSSRRISQEDLAARAGVSARHLSFVETGKSNPSRELVVALAGALDIPLRDRNALLAAAGFAAIYRASSFEADELAQLRRALDHVLRQQEPYGAVVVDGRWNVLRTNAGAARLFERFPPTTPEGLDAARNVLLGVVHPGALKPYIVNWDEAAGHLVARLHRDVAARPGDDELRRLLARVLALPEVPAQCGQDGGAVPAGAPALAVARDPAVHDAHVDRHAARRHRRGAPRRDLLPRGRRERRRDPRGHQLATLSRRRAASSYSAARSHARANARRSTARRSPVIARPASCATTAISRSRSPPPRSARSPRLAASRSISGIAWVGSVPRPP
jgi:transcriptional regulator with XRE-family HTH domain